MNRSRSAQTMLDQYRKAAAPGEATRERLLNELTGRAAAFEVPSIAPIAPPSVPAPAAPAGWTLGRTRVAGLLGASTLLLTFAFLWRGQESATQETKVLRVIARPLEAPAAPAASGSLAPQHEPEPSATAERLKPPSNARPAAASAPETPSKMQVTAESSAAQHEPKSPAMRTSPSAMGSRGVVSSFGPRPTTTLTTDSVAISSATSSDELEDELGLLRSAYEALRKKKPERALGLLDQHASRFPEGALSESRKVARIIALCQAGSRESARAEAARFLELSPRSPHAARVRSLCADPSDLP